MTASSPTSPPALRAAGRVLVVDASADAAWALASVLELRGFAVRTADPADALAAAGEFRPHAVVAALPWPAADGCSLVERLAALPPAERPAVVALAGWADAALRRRLAECGAAAVLLRPADLAALTGLLRSACERRMGGGAAGGP